MRQGAEDVKRFLRECSTLEGMVTDALRPEAPVRAAVRWRRWLRQFAAMAGVETPSTIPQNDTELRINDRRAQIPQWLFLGLFVYGATGVWWAATLQSDVRHLEQENLKLWQEIRTAQLLLDKVEKDLQDDMREEVKDEVTDQLLSRGIIRVSP